MGLGKTLQTFAGCLAAGQAAVTAPGTTDKPARHFHRWWFARKA